MKSKKIIKIGKYEYSTEINYDACGFISIWELKKIQQEAVFHILKNHLNDEVDPEVLHFARRTLGKTTKEMAKILNINNDQIVLLENNAEDPLLHFKYKKSLYDILLLNEIL